MRLFSSFLAVGLIFCSDGKIAKISDPFGHTELAAIPICRTSTGTWQNISTPVYTTPFTVEFDATPSTSSVDAMIGTSEGWTAAQKHLMTTVRFTTDGKIKALDASSYRAETVVSYTGGTAYHFRIQASFATDRYSAYVRTGSGAEKTIASNYRVRTSQKTTTKQNNLGMKAFTGSINICYGDSGTVTPPPDTTTPPIDTTGMIAIAPGDNWQTKINAYPTGTSFHVLTGTHVQPSATPKTGDQFIADAGAVMDGQNAQSFAFLGAAQNVVIKGLEIKNYTGGGTHIGAINAYDAVNWRLENLNVHDNQWIGANLRGNFTVVGGRYHHNGQYGLTVYQGNGGTVDGAELSYNNLAGVSDPLWDAGGTKVSSSTSVTFRNVYSHHNNGPGIWYDINNQNSVIENNRSELNTEAGIFYEISMAGIIRGNTATGNGTADINHTGANILVSASRDVQVYGNTVSGSHGIIGLQEARGNNSLGQINQVINLNVHDNTVTLPSGKRSGLIDFISSADGTAMVSSRNNRFDLNTYDITGNTLPFYGGYGLTAISKTAWQGLGKDLNSTFITPVTSIPISPGESWQTKVNAYPENTTFRPLAGTHVQQTVIPKSGDKFLCDAGAIMDGQNVKQFAFWEGNGPAYPNNVTIRRCEIRNYATPNQLAVVRMNSYSPTGARGWIIDSNHVHHNAAVGVRLGPFGLAKYNNLHDNGTLGISGVGDRTAANGGIIVEYNEVHHNNPSGTQLDFEAGGSKFVLTYGLIIRNNFFHHNKGPGPWLDIANINYRIHNNTVEDNTREGISVEISYGGEIDNNILRRNGLDDPRAANWPWGAGIGIHASGGTGIRVHDNLLEYNAHCIALIQQARGTAHGDPGGALLDAEMYVQNVTVDHNTCKLDVTQTGHVQPGSLGATLGADDTGRSNNLFNASRNISINFNTYVLDGRPYPFAWNNGYRNASYWRTCTAGAYAPATPCFDVGGSVTP